MFDGAAAFPCLHGVGNAPASSDRRASASRTGEPAGATRPGDLGKLDEAIDHYREALRIDPDFALAHYSLGVALVAKSRRDEAEDYPEGAGPLEQFGKLALREANDYYKQTYDFAPQWVVARNILQVPAQDRARLDEAIDHYRLAIRIEPGLPRPHGALGQALLAKWQLVEAAAATRRCLELLPPGEKDLRGKLESQRQRCCRLLALESRLAGIVRGADKPADDERLEAAELCFVKKHFATAVRLYTEALTATPQLTDDLRAGHRFNAARAAALAGCGYGDDVARFTESDLNSLRKQARAWLRIDLSAWAKKIDTGTAADRIQAHRTLSQWQQDAELNRLRDPEALAKLPPAECQEWRALWSELDKRIKPAASAK